MRRVVHFLSSAPLCQSAFSLPHLLFYCSEEVGSLCLYENKSEVSGRCCFLQIECKIFFFSVWNAISFPSEWRESSVGCQHDAPCEVASTLILWPWRRFHRLSEIQVPENGSYRESWEERGIEKGRENHIQTSWVTSHLFPKHTHSPSLPTSTITLVRRECVIKLKHNFADLKNCVHCLFSQLIL